MKSRMSRPTVCEQLAHIVVIKQSTSANTWSTKPSESQRKSPRDAMNNCEQHYARLPGFGRIGARTSQESIFDLPAERSVSEHSWLV